MSAVRERHKLTDPIPDYVMGDLLMKNECIENDVWYAGCIPGVPVEVDVTNRTDVLRIIDRGKKEGSIPLQLSIEDDAVFSLSKNEINVYRKNTENEVLLLRVPIPEIAAVCYIKDDGLHTLAIKYGNPDKCDLAVLYCKTQAQADNICASLGQCFQWAYQEATMQLLEITINEASKVPDNGMASSDGSGTVINNQPSFISGSDSELKRLPQRTSSVGEKSETSSSHAVLVKEYMKDLPKIFSFEELQEFSSLFQALNDPLKTDISEVCDKIYKLYGPERRHHITGLCPFIPSNHYHVFEKFLKDKGVDVSENGHSTLSSRHSITRIYTRSQSDVSTMNASDLDNVLERLSVELEKMNASVGDVNNSYIYTNSSDTG